MAPLTAAQIQNAVVALEPDAADQQIDFSSRVAIVPDDVAVSFEVERVEQGTPPVGRQVTFKIRNWTQSPGTNMPVALQMVELRTAGIAVGRMRLGGGPY